MMEQRMNPYTKVAGFATFIWRIALTTGTGSIFGFLVARQAYGSALLAPMFIIMSFGYGLAIFIIVQGSPCTAWNNHQVWTRAYSQAHEEPAGSVRRRGALLHHRDAPDQHLRRQAVGFRTLPPA
jgi:hypothetical protein